MIYYHETTPPRPQSHSLSPRSCPSRTKPSYYSLCFPPPLLQGWLLHSAWPRAHARMLVSALYIATEIAHSADVRPSPPRVASPLLLWHGFQTNKQSDRMLYKAMADSAPLSCTYCLSPYARGSTSPSPSHRYSRSARRMPRNQLLQNCYCR